MKSPFPGMDPYLESHWLDVHTSLVTSARNALNERLPENLVARAEERIAIEAGPDDPINPDSGRHLAPDVRVFEAVAAGGAAVAGNGGGLALAPYRLVLLNEPVTERFIEIIDLRGGERLVTVIEFVNPTNKTGPGLGAFVQKRSELLAGGVNFLESICVVRVTGAGCSNRTAAPKVRWPRTGLSSACPRTHSRLTCSRFPFASLCPWSRSRYAGTSRPRNCPCSRSSRRPTGPGRYGRTINYARPAEPPLAGIDAAWADTLLKAASER